MKKYTILDSTGQKKIVYAPNMKKALRYVGDGEKTVKDSKVKDEDDYFYFDADEDDRSLDDYKRIMKQCGLTITKVEGNNREAFIYYRGSSSAEQKAAKMLGISLEDSIKDSRVKDIDDSKLDDVSVNKNDWLTFRKDNDKAVYKVIDIYDNSYTLEKYTILYDVFSEKKVDIIHEGRLYFTKNDLRYHDVVKFNSANEAINWLKQQKRLAAKKYENFLAEWNKVKDSDTNIVDKLIGEEEKAVMDYKEALMADSDLSANAVYAHILAEELEHLRELRSLREQPSLGDSIKDEVQTAETYANTGWIEKLASDLLNEGQKNGYNFDAVLKKFDSLSKQILVIVKNALDKAKKEVVDYKSRY